MKKDKKQKMPMYFDAKQFIDDVMKEMQLDETPAPIRLELREAIFDRLSDRIMSTVLSSFEEKDVVTFENMLDDHPELDELDVVMIVAKQVKGLKERLERQINSLFSELTYDAMKIKEAMNAESVYESVSKNVNQNLNN